MRAATTVAFLCLLGASLSGCAVASVGVAVIDAGATVVGTTVDVASSTVGAAGRAVTGGDSDEDKKKDSDD